MTPADIAAMAALKGLDIVALTDHNSALNCPAFFACAKRAGITPIAGLEVCTAEEIHVLCLFAELDAALALSERIYRALPPVTDMRGVFGEQLVMDEHEHITGRVAHLLTNAADIGFDALYDEVTASGGVFIPAHIDRPSNSLLSQFGWVPPDSRFTCAEVAHPENLPGLLAAHPYLRQCRIITGSDAHSLGNISEARHFLHAASSGAGDVLRALSQPITFSGD